MTGKAQVTLFDQTSGQTGSGVASQVFESSFSQYDCMAADDFVVASGEQWHLDSLEAFGQYVSPSGTPVPGAGIVVSIFSDNSGQPGAVVFTDTVLSGSDPDSDGSLFYDFNSLVLNPGHYWIGVSAKKDLGTANTQWELFSSTSGQGDTAQWQNPGGGFPLLACTSWGSLNTCLSNLNIGLSLKLYGCPDAGPYSSLHADTAFCANDSLVLTADTALGYSWEWSGGATSASVTFQDSGTYYVTITDTTTGCFITDTMTTHVWPQPIVDLQNDSFCQGDTGMLGVTGCNSCSYLWNTGSSDSAIYPTDSGSYSVTVTNQFGCENDGSATTIAFPNPEPVLTQSGFGSDWFVHVTDSFAFYQWWPDTTVTGSHYGGVPYDQWVSVTVTDTNGCRGTDSIYAINGIDEMRISAIQVFPNPTTGLVRFKVDEVSPVHVVVLNAQGQKVVERRAFDTLLPLDVNHLPSGVYSLYFADEIESRFVRLVIE